MKVFQFTIQLGTPISSTIANVIMEELEIKVIAGLDFTPHFINNMWKIAFYVYQEANSNTLTNSSSEAAFYC